MQEQFADNLYSIIFSTATASPAYAKLCLAYGSYTQGTEDYAGIDGGTVAGKRAESRMVQITNSGYVGANNIQFVAKKYGEDFNLHIIMSFDAKEGQEEFEEIDAPTYDADGKITRASTYELHLMSGKEYSEQDLETIIAKAGVPLEIKLSGEDPDEPNTLFVASNFSVGCHSGMTSSSNGTVTVVNGMNMTGGQGLGDEDAYLGQPKYNVASGGNGVILQVGANEGQTMSFSIDDMSAKALGVHTGHVDLSNQSAASKSIGAIDGAIAKVSKQRALLGAVQNRLEHTISNLDNTAENIQAAESTIRDVDMAEMMVQYSKNNILQQAGTSMLAQANQATQGVLSLLQG